MRRFAAKLVGVQRNNAALQMTSGTGCATAIAAASRALASSKVSMMAMTRVNGGNTGRVFPKLLLISPGLFSTVARLSSSSATTSAAPASHQNAIPVSTAPPVDGATRRNAQVIEYAELTGELTLALRAKNDKALATVVLPDDAGVRDPAQWIEGRKVPVFGRVADGVAQITHVYPSKVLAKSISATVVLIHPKVTFCHAVLNGKPIKVVLDSRTALADPTTDRHRALEEGVTVQGRLFDESPSPLLRNWTCVAPERTPKASVDRTDKLRAEVQLSLHRLRDEPGGVKTAGGIKGAARRSREARDAEAKEQSHALPPELNGVLFDPNPPVPGSSTRNVTFMAQKVMLPRGTELKDGCDFVLADLKRVDGQWTCVTATAVAPEKLPVERFTLAAEDGRHIYAQTGSGLVPVKFSKMANPDVGIADFMGLRLGDAITGAVVHDPHNTMLHSVSVAATVDKRPELKYRPGFVTAVWKQQPSVSQGTVRCQLDTEDETSHVAVTMPTGAAKAFKVGDPVWYRQADPEDPASSPRIMHVFTSRRENYTEHEVGIVRSVHTRFGGLEVCLVDIDGVNGPAYYFTHAVNAPLHTGAALRNIRLVNFSPPRDDLVDLSQCQPPRLITLAKPYLCHAVPAKLSHSPKSPHGRLTVQLHPTQAQTASSGVRPNERALIGRAERERLVRMDASPGDWLLCNVQIATPGHHRLFAFHSKRMPESYDPEAIVDDGTDARMPPPAKKQRPSGKRRLPEQYLTISDGLVGWVHEVNDGAASLRSLEIALPVPVDTETVDLELIASLQVGTPVVFDMVMDSNSGVECVATNITVRPPE